MMFSDEVVCKNSVKMNAEFLWDSVSCSSEAAVGRETSPHAAALENIIFQSN